MVRNILRIAQHRGVPVLFSLEGGYNLKALGESVSVTVEEMLAS